MMVKNYKEMCELIVKLIDQLSATERFFDILRRTNTQQ